MTSTGLSEPGRRCGPRRLRGRTLRRRVASSEWAFSIETIEKGLFSFGLCVSVILTGCSPAADSSTLASDQTDTECSRGDELGIRGDSYEIGMRMADVELGAPAEQGFLLRATLPVPPRTYPRGVDIDLFSILAPDGTKVPAQTEIVTRYAAPPMGADVVEVIAPVQVPPGTAPQERIHYAIVWDPHRPDELALAPTVQELVQEIGSISARTRDVFGHVYSADLLVDWRDDSRELKWFRRGSWVEQLRTHEWLVPESPVAGPEGTLPHLMGLHSYVTFYHGEEYFSLDLRVHNGASGLSPHTPLDDALTDIHFDSLELRLPAGWTVLASFRDPFFGDPLPAGSQVLWPIVKRLEGNDLHVMPQQGQFQRRLVISRDDPEVLAKARVALLEGGLAFVRPLKSDGTGQKWSWWNRKTARYFPQALRLPDFSFLGEDEAVRADLAGRFAAHLEALEEGTVGPWPILSDVMGWCHPWGTAFGGMHGGSEIFFFDGLRTVASASLEGYRFHQLSQRMYACRHPVALYNEDGRASRVEDWTRRTSSGVAYLPVWIFMRPYLNLGDPFGFGDAPTFQQNEVIRQGRRPRYSWLLHQYQALDIQHIVRYTRSLKALAWLGNDALAKDDLLMQAELMRFSYSPLPQEPHGQGIATGMFQDMKFVASHPAQGLDVTRGEGWLTDTIVAAYRLGDPEWRAEVYPWFGELLQLFSDGQEDCSGTIGSVPNYAWFGSSYRTRQSISQAIIEHGLWGVRNSVFAGRDEEKREQLDALLRKSFHSMTRPTFWSDVDHAPYFYVAVGPFDTDEPSFCGFLPDDGHFGDDHYQTWSALAWGFQLTRDPIFMDRARELADGDLWGAAEGDARGELENRAAFLLLLQELSGY